MTPLVVAILVCGLAGYRLARAVAVDDISAPLREWLHDQAYEVGPDPAYPSAAPFIPSVMTDTRRPWSWLYGLADCPFCAGFWITLALYAFWVNVTGWPRAVVAALAATGVQAWLTRGDG